MSSKGGEATEEKPAKRPRLGALKQDSDAAVAVTFDDLNNDCLVNILSFMETEEMNDATLIDSAFRKARNADSLDQTRTATIIVKTKTTFSWFLIGENSIFERPMLIVDMMLSSLQMK